MRHIDVIKYVGNKDEQVLKAWGHATDHTERQVTFTKGEIKYIGVNIQHTTASFLKRDYPSLIRAYQEKLEDVEIFGIYFEKLLRDFSCIKKAALIKKCTQIFDDIAAERNKERGKNAANARWEKEKNAAKVP